MFTKKRAARVTGWSVTGCGSRRLLLTLAVIGFAVLLLATGCVNMGTQPEPQEAETPPVSPHPDETKTALTLYFSDREAQFLTPEEREVVRKGISVEEALVKELIAGPADNAHGRTIPQETRLISISVASGVAYVNFSKELQTKHWGGSAGETMTVYSVVNSLAGLPGINEVQFLIDGSKVETLAGHIELTSPLRPNWLLVPDRPVKLGTVPMDINKLKEVQAEVDNGHQAWRLDPLQVVMSEGPALGLNPAVDNARLISRAEQADGAQGEAKVEVKSGGKTYLVKLAQPVKQGQSGIWTIQSVEEEKN
ncbi:MAG: GerMN domain-containing protein [Desulfotomaculaceae bacterium]|nr:GerMN domain-containing protein [Desulfotomaculaceae bacterium]